MSSTSLYFAARFSFRETLRAYRDDLPVDVEVVSTWIDEATDSPLPFNCAQRDLRDLLSANTIVAFAPESRSNSRGANHTELGIAIRLRRIRTIVVGPLADDGNVFHHLCERFPTWEQARSTL
jgi:hypothetical protein